MEHSHIIHLKTHQDYIIRAIFDYNSSRLPHKLRKIVLQKQIYWTNDIRVMQNNIEPFGLSSAINRANQTTRIYSKLDPSVGQTYINSLLISEEKMWVFKAGSDILKHNSNNMDANRNPICSLCIFMEAENLPHFLCNCPIFKEFRIMFFKKTLLKEDDLINILNGYIVNWKYVASFIKICTQYRNQLLSEFNF